MNDTKTERYILTTAGGHTPNNWDEFNPGACVADAENEILIHGESFWADREKHLPPWLTLDEAAAVDRKMMANSLRAAREEGWRFRLNRCAQVVQKPATV